MYERNIDIKPPLIAFAYSNLQREQVLTINLYALVILVLYLFEMFLSFNWHQKNWYPTISDGNNSSYTGGALYNMNILKLHGPLTKSRAGHFWPMIWQQLHCFVYYYSCSITQEHKPIFVLSQKSHSPNRQLHLNLRVCSPFATGTLRINNYPLLDYAVKVSWEKLGVN